MCQPNETGINADKCVSQILKYSPFPVAPIAQSYRSTAMIPGSKKNTLKMRPMVMIIIT